jgi:hypothetical protein
MDLDEPVEEMLRWRSCLFAIGVRKVGFVSSLPVSLEEVILKETRASSVIESIDERA